MADEYYLRDCLSPHLDGYRVRVLGTWKRPKVFEDRHQGKVWVEAETPNGVTWLDMARLRKA